jgi:hypothetical protein
MSKSNNFPKDTLIDGYTLDQDKDGDGSKHSIRLKIEPDYNKEVFDILDSRNSSFMLKYDERWNSYFWNYCAGSYFCNDSLL